MSESNVGGVRRGYESPTARIVAVESGCVVRASVWTAAPFDPTTNEGDWYDANGDVTAAPFDESPFLGLWCDGSNSSNAAPFDQVVIGGTWDESGDGSKAGTFDKVEGSW